VARHDPHVSEGSEPLEAVLAGARAVIVATNHTEYDHLLPRLPDGAIVVDPWNVTGTGEVFALAGARVRA
jgi:hypothetical protein